MGWQPASQSLKHPAQPASAKRRSRTGSPRAGARTGRTTPTLRSGSTRPAPRQSTDRSPDGRRGACAGRPSSRSSRQRHGDEAPPRNAWSKPAIDSASFSAGVRKPRVFRGRRLSLSATSSSWLWVIPARLCRLGKYWRNSPMMFRRIPVARGSGDRRSKRRPRTRPRSGGDR